MKTIKILLLNLFIASIVLVSCSKDFLEKYPTDEVFPGTFFQTADELQLYINSFYPYFGNGQLWPGDDETDNTLPGTYSQWKRGEARAPGSDGGWDFEELRNINFFLDAVAEHKPSIPDDRLNHYIGIARLSRAWFYYNKVKSFGDVPWYGGVLESESEALYKPRDSRVLVMDSVLADLNFACQWIADERSTTAFTRIMALAVKSRICLYEGTWRKYHSEAALPDADKFLDASAAASEEIMQSGAVRLHDTGHPESDYGEIFNSEDLLNDEVIFGAVYNGEIQQHSANYDLRARSRRDEDGLKGKIGANKSLINAYLMRDGRTIQEAYPAGASDTLSWYQESQNRDFRLSQTVFTPGYKRIGASNNSIPDFLTALSGYQYNKYLTSISDDSYRLNTSDLPIFRYAEVLLNYAESKAELGTITQTDLDNTINLLRKRAGITKDLTISAPLDPVLDARYENCSNPLILEIRRERRVELALEGFRFDDLMRWKEGQIFREKQTGMYFKSMGQIDLDHDGSIDILLTSDPDEQPASGVQKVVIGSENGELSEGTKGYLIPYPEALPAFQAFYYLQPIPKDQLVLNSELQQNPGW
jgi:hypothetical protein